MLAREQSSTLCIADTFQTDVGIFVTNIICDGCFKFKIARLRFLFGFLLADPVY